MTDWRLHRHPEHDGWYAYSLLMDGGLVATARWRNVAGQFAELHNEIHKATPSVIRKVRESFAAIKDDARAAGLSRIIVCQDEFDGKMVRYWRLMGFTKFFATTEV